MEFGKKVCLLMMMMVIMVGCLSLSESYKFYVGGRDGWRTDPFENYIHWAQTNRFQINDTLFFGYEKGNDSVLLVSEDDYYKCHKSKPLQYLSYGESGSEFTFHRSGPFYFISGRKNHCEKGQKLVVIVLSPRTKPSPPLSPSPAPLGNSTATSPPSPSRTSRLAPVPAPAVNSGGSMGCSFGLSVFVMAITFGVFYY